MAYALNDVTQNSDYDITLFKPEELAALELFDKKGKPYLKDFVDGKERLAKPEEIVLQLYLRLQRIEEGN